VYLFPQKTCTLLYFWFDLLMKKFLLCLSFSVATSFASSSPFDPTDVTNTVDFFSGVYYPKWMHHQPGPSNNGDVTIGGVIVAGPDAFWQPTLTQGQLLQNIMAGIQSYTWGTSIAANPAAYNYLIATDGNPTLQDLAKTEGFCSTSDTNAFLDAFNGNGLTPPTLLGDAQSVGYQSVDDWLNAWYGTTDVNASAIAAGFGIGDTNAFLTSIGGAGNLSNWALTNGYLAYTTQPLTTPDQQNAMIAAIANGSVSASAISGMMEGTLLQADDGQFIQNAITAAQNAHNTNAVQALYNGIIVDQTGSPNDGWGNSVNQYLDPTQLSLIDFSNYKASDQNLNNVNLSALPGITGTNLNGVSSLVGANLTGLDLTGWTPTPGTDLSSINLTGTTGFTAADITALGNGLWSGATHSFSGAILTGTGITRTDVYNAVYANWLAIDGDPIAASSDAASEADSITY